MGFWDRFTDANGNLKFVVFMVKRPCVVIMCSLGLAMLLSVLAIFRVVSADKSLISSPRSDADLSHISSINSNSWELARDFINDNKVQIQSSNGTVPQQSKSGGVVLFVFEATKGGNAFTKPLLAKAKSLQDAIIKHPEYPMYCKRDPKAVYNSSTTALQKCNPPFSPLLFFYAGKWNETEVDAFIKFAESTSNFTEKTSRVLQCLQNPTIQKMLFAHMKPNATAPNMFTLYAKVLSICPSMSSVPINEIFPLVQAVQRIQTMSKDFDGSGPLRNPDKVVKLCSILLKVPTMKPFIDFFFDRNFNAKHPVSQFTRMLVEFGVPLAGYKNSTDRKAEQKDKFNKWFQKNFRAILQDDKEQDSFKTYYFATSLILEEILAVMFVDLGKAFFSMLFVYFYMAFQTGSFFIATAGMIEILFSLPFAYSIYSLIFQFEYLGTLCSMCVYIVLAIGADDVFVFMDAYKQSAFQGPEVLKDLETRLSWVYRRAASAMVITSFTTMAAFVATAVSPLPSVQSFGIYAAFVILADYILVITFFPACVVFYHNNIERRGICANCKCCSKTDETSTEIYATAKDSPPERKVEVFLAKTFGPFITKFRLFIVIFFFIWLGAACIISSKVTPATKSEQFLPDDHPFQRIIDISADNFGASSQDIFVEITYVWGVKGVNRDGVHLLYDSEYLGKVEWDSSFVFDKAAQSHIYSVSKETQRNTSMIARDKDDPFKAAATSFIDDFALWANSTYPGGFPVAKEKVNDALTKFLSSTKKVNGRPQTMRSIYGSLIGISEGKLYYVALRFESLLDKNVRYTEAQLRKDFNSFQEYMKRINSRAPPTANKAFQTDSNNNWVKMRNQELYLSSAIIGAITGILILFISISLATLKYIGTCLAFVVILLATRSLLIAFFAAFSIAGILISVLAFMVSLGWEMGMIESINLTILAGFSVDYVVHLAHAYTSSKGATRNERIHEAIGEIGISVFSGMITSVGASLLLFMCMLQFFFKFGGFLCSTVLFSWFWANFFFMALLSFAGPTDNQHILPRNEDKS